MGLFPEWTWVVGLLIGAAIGSFLNVVIYRLPRRISLHNPPNSFCPRCKHRLGILDLFPLFSWLLSRGRCRYCKEPIAPRYFFVELLTGGLWAGIWWQNFIVGWDVVRFFAFAFAAASLVAIIFIDWELYIIPDEINAMLLAIGVGYHAINRTLMTALVGALLGWGLLWGIAMLGRLLFRKDAMGHGDIKMMRGVGAVIGPLLLTASLGIAVVAGLVIGLALIAIVRRQAAGDAEEEEEGEYEPESVGGLLLAGAWYLFCMDVWALFFPRLNKLVGAEAEETLEEDDWKPSLTTIPFGPYLAIGALVCMLFPGPIERTIGDWWRTQTGAEENVAAPSGQDAPPR